MSGLTTLLLAHDLERIRYPYLPCINSVLPISDEVLVIDCDTTDDSIEQIRALNDPRIRILKGEWGTHYTIQGKMINLGISEVKTPFFFQIDADEVLYETSYREMQAIVDFKGNLEAARPNYIHFVSDFSTTFPFIYLSRIRIAKTGCGWWAVGDACDIDKQGKPNVYQTKEVKIAHFGKIHVGRRKQALYKESSFQELYRDLGFPDRKVVDSLPSGVLNYDYVFGSTKDEGKFQPFTGEYPEFAKEWMAMMIQRDKDEGY